MLQLASSRGPLQSLFCSRPNTTLSALTTLETPTANIRDAPDQGSTASCTVTAWGAKKEQGLAANGCWKVLYRGLCGEAQMISLPPPPSASGLALTLCLLYQRLEKVPSKNVPQEAHSDSGRMPMSPWSCHAQPHQQGQASGGRGTCFLVQTGLCR